MSVVGHIWQNETPLSPHKLLVKRAAAISHYRASLHAACCRFHVVGRRRAEPDLVRPGAEPCCTELGATALVQGFGGKTWLHPGVFLAAALVGQWFRKE